MKDFIMGINVDELRVKIFIFLIAISITAVIARFVRKLLEKVLDRTSIPNASIFINLGRGLVWLLCILAIMEPVFGITPTAFMAAFGITSLVISFGLQSTVENLVSGLELMGGKVIQVGDIIEISGFRGEVVDINWRSTTLLNRFGDYQIIPNASLNSTALTRLDPATAAKYIAPIVIAHDADLEAVTKEIKELACPVLAGQLKEEFYDGVRVIITGTDVYGTQASVFFYLKDEIVPYAAIDMAMRKIADRPWIARER